MYTWRPQYTRETIWNLISGFLTADYIDSNVYRRIQRAFVACLYKENGRQLHRDRERIVEKTSTRDFFKSSKPSDNGPRIYDISSLIGTCSNKTSKPHFNFKG